MAEENVGESVDVLQVERELMEKYFKYVCDEPLASALMPLLQGELLLSATTDEILRRCHGETAEQLRFVVGYLLKRENVENYVRFWKCVEVASSPNHSLIKKVNEKRAAQGVDPIPTRTAEYFKERQILGDFVKVVCETVQAADVLPVAGKKLKISQTERTMLRHCDDNFGKVKLLLNNLLLKRTAEQHQEFWRCVQNASPLYHQLVSNVDTARTRFGLPPLYERPKGEFNLKVTYAVHPSESRTHDNVFSRRHVDAAIFQHVKEPLEKQPDVIHRLLRSDQVKCLKVLNGSICVSVLPDNAKALQAMQESLVDEAFSDRFREVLKISDLEEEHQVCIRNIKSRFERRELLRARDELVAAGEPEDMWYTDQELEKMRQQLRSAPLRIEEGELLVSTEWAERYNKFTGRKTDELPGPVEYIEPALIMELDSTVSVNTPGVLAIADRLFGKTSAKRVLKKAHGDMEICFFELDKSLPTHATVCFYESSRFVCRLQVQVNVTFNRIYRELHGMGLIVDGPPDAPPTVHGKIIDPDAEKEDNEEKPKPTEESNADVKVEEVEEPRDSEENKKEDEVEEEDDTQKPQEPKNPEIKYKLTSHESQQTLDRWLWTTATIDGAKHIVWDEADGDDDQNADDSDDEEKK